MTAIQPPARLPDLLPLLAGIGSVLYPFLVYFGLPHLPPGLLVALAVGIGALHLLRRRQQGRRGRDVMSRWGFLAIGCVLFALLAMRPVLAVQAYPPLVSLSLAGTFAWSLLHPPTAVERIARLRRPNLPAEAVAYTRNVTKVWTVFFVTNAAISSICALCFSVAVWTLWTGLISYLLIGAMVIGEVMVRRWVLQRAAA